MKYAYLIIAHNEWEVLQKLVSALDDERNEIFIHFDKKVKSVPDITCNKSALHIVKNRVDVRWGDVSQIECQYKLWEDAYRYGPFKNYILISGVHYPLKSNDVICEFWERHLGQNLIQGLEKEELRQELIKVHRYNFFMRQYEYGSRRRRIFFQWLCTNLNAAQRIIGLDRNKQVDFWRGANWTVLSQEGVEYMIRMRARAIKIFSLSFCADEYLVPTMLSESARMKDTIFSTDSLLHQEIIRANARVFTENDLPELLESSCLFVRKINKENINILDKLELCRQQ
ncbi:MAG: beta-1,6-N-acetylglucosaminyltransferase [Bacteroidales bacterium]|nr:beta-1,6-N-acetylglucosaminyltransferase [Bacteroidales bacterium]